MLNYVSKSDHWYISTIVLGIPMLTITLYYSSHVGSIVPGSVEQNSPEQITRGIDYKGAKINVLNV